MEAINSQINSTFHFSDNPGLIFVDGDVWQEQRRFTLRHLRDLGFGKTSIEDQMMDEIADLISEFRTTAESNPDHVVDFKSIFSVSVINILWAIIGGKRFQRDDPKFKKLLDNIDQFLGSGNVAQANLPIPAFLVRLFPSLPGRLGIKTQLFVPIQKFIEVGLVSSVLYILFLHRGQQSKKPKPIITWQMSISRRLSTNILPPDRREMLPAITWMSTRTKWRSSSRQMAQTAPSAVTRNYFLYNSIPAQFYSQHI
jgi:hypothetical protein